MIIIIRNKLKEILNYKIDLIYLERNIINSYKLITGIGKPFYNKDSIGNKISKINKNLSGIKHNQFK